MADRRVTDDWGIRRIIVLVERDTIAADGAVMKRADHHIVTDQSCPAISTGDTTEVKVCTNKR